MIHSIELSLWEISEYTGRHYPAIAKALTRLKEKLNKCPEVTRELSDLGQIIEGVGYDKVTVVK
jgi:hypothetical protein